jgi:hypothetical protein
MPDVPVAREDPAALVAVTEHMADALQNSGLAVPLPALRGTVVDVALIVGTDAATVVTLMQAPDTIRRFASWLYDYLSRPVTVSRFRVDEAGQR